MSTRLLGRIGWDMERDKEGHETFNIFWLVKSTDKLNGPRTIASTAGLPIVGTSWAYGNDSNPWAFCYPTLSVVPLDGRNGQAPTMWRVGQIFSTKPLSRCNTTSPTNPILEPMYISGSFVKYTREAKFDRLGRALKSSSHEFFVGKDVERDYNRATLSFRFNTLTLPLGLLAGAMDTVNDANIWGLTPRMAKLSQVRFERKLYGTCNYYYTISYGFDIDFNTFDRVLVDRGTKVLMDGGDVDNPEHFAAKKDARGQRSTWLLNGAGQLLAAGANPVTTSVELYFQSNFLLLGVPPGI